MFRFSYGQILLQDSKNKLQPSIYNLRSSSKVNIYNFQQRKQKVTTFKDKFSLHGLLQGHLYLFYLLLYYSILEQTFFLFT
jgi:hypothetical protein